MGFWGWQRIWTVSGYIHRYLFMYNWIDFPQSISLRLFRHLLYPSNRWLNTSLIIMHHFHSIKQLLVPWSGPPAQRKKKHYCLIIGNRFGFSCQSTFFVLFFTSFFLSMNYSYRPLCACLIMLFELQLNRRIWNQCFSHF